MSAARAERFDRWIQRATVGAVLLTALLLIGTGVALITQQPAAASVQLSAGR